MKRSALPVLAGVVLASTLSVLPRLAAAAGPACTPAWYKALDERLQTSDGLGHGPDIGSDEWKSTVEFKLGLRGRTGVPATSSPAWCAYIDSFLAQRAGGRAAPGASATAGPSFSCSKTRADSIEALICADKELSALDRKLAGVYDAALKRAVNERPPVLKSSQRGWIKGRNECWKADDKRGCVLGSYQLRIAELQATYRLVAANGPVRYLCTDRSEVEASFFQTDPPTMIAERGDSRALMYVQPSGSGARYAGQDTMFWEHQGEALMRWGQNAAEINCRPAR